MKEKYDNHLYWELLYIRDVQKYGNLYSKFYFFETQLTQKLKEKNIDIKHKKDTPSLSTILDIGCSKGIISKEDKKVINDARDAIFHYKNSILQFPYKSHNIEEILDKYITKFSNKKYTTKGNVVPYTKNIMTDELKNMNIKIAFKPKSKEFSFTHNDKKFEGFLSFMPQLGGGGGQIKEYKKLTLLIENHSRNCKEKNTIFLAICDGDYYLQKDSKTKDETKITRLQKLTDNKTSFVLNINELHVFLSKCLTI